MKFAKITTFLLLWFLVAIEIYLISSSIIEKKNEESEVKNYCQARCNYEPENMLWEFSGEGVTKGFTTNDECFKYCSQVKQGYVYNVLSSGTAALLSNLSNIIGK